MRDLRWTSPITFNRITSASEVANSAEVAVTGVKDIGYVRFMLETRANPYHTALGGFPFVSYGEKGAVQLLDFQAANCQQDPRGLKTRGTQRVRVRFSVTSINGIKKINIHDGDRGVLRSFDGKNAQEVTREFELVHDKQHYIYLDVKDTKGNKLVSHSLVLFDYKQGLYRCGDNLNILGPLGLVWMPDRSNIPPHAKQIRNAILYSYTGEDTAGALGPQPTADCMNLIYLDKLGERPRLTDNENVNLRMDVLLGSGDIQVVDSHMDYICERFDNAVRPGPAVASPARYVKEHPYFKHTQRLYSARDRVDFHVQWDNRREIEALDDYDGSFQFIEGKITFNTDVTFCKHHHPSVWLGRIGIHPWGQAKNFDDKLIWLDPAKGEMTLDFKAGQKKSINGTVNEKGYVALMSSKIGYLGVIPTNGTVGFNYTREGFLRYGIQLTGKSFKAGDVLRYSFVVGVFSDKARDHKKIAQAAAILRDKAYSNTIKKGTLNKNGFFYDVTAKDNQAAFTLHKAGLGIDLPIRIRGLEDNGCVAAYSTNRPWFRFVGFDANEKNVYFQDSIDQKNDIWVGNVFLASDKNLKLTLVVDGQADGKPPFLEIHNPTGKAISAKIWSPAGTPQFGGKSFTVTIPAKDSVFCYTDGRKKQ